MTDARAFRGFRSPAEVIFWAVRWYLQFPVSYRGLELMLADRGVAVDRTTMYRWVQRFAPDVALAGEVVVQRPQSGPKLARWCDGAPAIRLAPGVIHDGADAIEADPGVPGLAVPQSPAQALDLLGNHRLRCGALGIVGRQAAGDP